MEMRKNKKNEKIEQINNEYHEQEERKKEYIESVVSDNNKRFKQDVKPDDKYSYIDKFIQNIVSHVGKDIKGEFPINLVEDIYYIDHDRYGHTIEGKPVIIRESDNKVKT